MNHLKAVTYVIALAVSLMFVWFTGPAHPSWAQEPGPSLGVEVAPEAITPARLMYQGRLSNPGTGEAISGTVAIIFRLYDDAAAGNKLWEEGKDIQVTAGLFNSALGDLTPLDAAIFNGQSLWLALKVGTDPEAIPRQQFLPVAYAMSLLPGATISTTAASPAMLVRNSGTGDALRVEGRLYVTGDLAVGGNLVGGAHNHDATYINAIGPDTMSGKDTAPILSLVQSGTGYGGYFTSIDGTGFRGDTRAAVNETAGIMGIAGTTSIALNNYAGVLGKSRYGYGVAGIGDASVGVWGQSAYSYGVYGLGSSSLAGVYGSNTGSGYGVQGVSSASSGVYGQSNQTSGAYAGVYGTSSTGVPGVYGSATGIGVYGVSTGSGNGVYGRSISGSAGVYGINSNGGGPGVQGYSSDYWGGYFSSGSGGALYAGGPSTVNGTLTTQKVAYSTPRTHYWSAGGEAFQATNNSSSFGNSWGNGGAYLCSNFGDALVAPVHLPHGAVVTRVTMYYLDNDASYDISLSLQGQYLASTGYAGFATVSSSGASVTDGRSAYATTNFTIDNTTWGYYLKAYSTNWAGCESKKVRGVVIQYAVSEAE